MNIKRTISITEARKRLFDIAKEVQKPDAYYTLTEKGKPKIVIMSAEEFDTWQETMEVNKQFPNLDKDSKEAWEAVERGEGVGLDELLLEHGYSRSDLLRDKKDVSKPHISKRPKRSKKNR